MIKTSPKILKLFQATSGFLIHDLMRAIHPGHVYDGS